MRILILVACLLAPVHAFANNHCRSSDHIAVKYFIWNASDYGIGLKFGEAKHGENPDNIYLDPYDDPVIIYGCSSGVFTGYETRATLMAHDSHSSSDFDLAYLYLADPFVGGDKFSYQKFDISIPDCRCKVRVGRDWEDMGSFIRCSPYIGPLPKRVEIRISCR